MLVFLWHFYTMLALRWWMVIRNTKPEYSKLGKRGQCSVLVKISSNQRKTWFKFHFLTARGSKKLPALVVAKIALKIPANRLWNRWSQTHIKRRSCTFAALSTQYGNCAINHQTLLTFCTGFACFVPSPTPASSPSSASINLFLVYR